MFLSFKILEWPRKNAVNFRRLCHQQIGMRTNQNNNFGFVLFSFIMTNPTISHKGLDRSKGLARVQVQTRTLTMWETGLMTWQWNTMHRSGKYPSTESPHLRSSQQKPHSAHLRELCAPPCPSSTSPQHISTHVHIQLLVCAPGN